MNSIADFMNKDHDRLDGLFKKFRQIKRGSGQVARGLFNEFKSGLERHIVWEEEILFPEFELRTGMTDGGPTAVMRAEHRQIEGFLNDIHNIVTSGGIQSDRLETELLDALTGHNGKEESILYPWIDKLLDEDKKMIILDRLNKSADEGCKISRC